MPPSDLDVLEKKVQALCLRCESLQRDANRLRDENNDLKQKIRQANQHLHKILNWIPKKK